jgi:hypothetical protein
MFAAQLSRRASKSKLAPGTEIELTGEGLSSVGGLARCHSPTPPGLATLDAPSLRTLWSPFSRLICSCRQIFYLKKLQSVPQTINIFTANIYCPLLSNRVILKTPSNANISLRSTYPISLSPDRVPPSPHSHGLPYKCIFLAPAPFHDVPCCLRLQPGRTATPWVNQIYRSPQFQPVFFPSTRRPCLFATVSAFGLTHHPTRVR